MANGLFSSRKLRDDARSVEDQIADLRAEIASLAGSLADEAASGAGRIRKRARAAKAGVSDAAHDLRDRAEGDIRDMIAAGEDIIADLQARYGDSGRKAREAVRERPLAALGVAAVAGFVLAALMRR